MTSSQGTAHLRNTARRRSCVVYSVSGFLRCIADILDNGEDAKRRAQEAEREAEQARKEAERAYEDGMLMVSACRRTLCVETLAKCPFCVDACQLAQGGDCASQHTQHALLCGMEGLIRRHSHGAPPRFLTRKSSFTIEWIRDHRALPSQCSMASAVKVLNMYGHLHVWTKDTSHMRCALMLAMPPRRLGSQVLGCSSISRTFGFATCPLEVLTAETCCC